MLSPAVAPDGALYVRDDPDALTIPDEGARSRIQAAFHRDALQGVLHLGAREVEVALPPPLAWLRSLGRLFMARLCALPELDALGASAEVPLPPEAELDALAASVPAMRGAEYVSAERLASWWSALHDAYRAALLGRAPSAWLRAQSPVWHAVGRVCFHLAERKGDPPFAFLATFASGVSASGRAQHVPLGRAVAESAELRDRARLDALLEPVRRAAAGSELVRALVDSGELFQPLGWSAAEAHAFLLETRALEAAGVQTRVPDWWAKRARPQVRVTLGGEAKTRLSASSLVDLAVDLEVEGEPLTPDEIASLRAAGSGLTRLRGRWIETDPARLDALLKQWREHKKLLREGVSLHDALRLLAGAQLGDSALGADLVDPAWTRVEAGPWIAETLAALRDPSRLGDVSLGEDLRAELRAYQRLGVRWLWSLTRMGLGACLADDMGLGKTLQVIALLALERRHRAGEAAPPSLIVAPASLLANWRAEIQHFAPGLVAKTAHPSAGRDAPPDDAAELARWHAGVDVVVTSYGAITRSTPMRDAAWNLCVLDEAQAIKNAETKQSRAVKSLKGRGRVALTGTPVENRLGDLWSLFDYLQPGLLGGAKQFGRYAKTLNADAAPEAWAPLRRLVQPYILRRLKSDKRVIADLPDKTEVTAWCPLTRAQVSLYRAEIDALERALVGAEDPTARRGAVLTALMRFKQVCNHPSQRTGDGRYLAKDSGKFGRLREIAEEIAERGEKVLVFTQFQEMTGPLAAHLAEVFGAAGAVLHGATPVKERARLVRVFQEDPSVPFFVLSLKAGGTGLNLTAAQHVVHFDRWWNPAVEDQATDRAYRIGQRRNVLVHRFACRGTLEEKVDELLREKRALAGAVLGAAGGSELALTEMSDRALLDLVSLDLSRALDEG
ncbi:MAG: DEAD/DEAH box helicase [Polyangiales bacterium]